MLDYSVQFYDDADMPDGHDWAACGDADQMRVGFRDSIRHLPVEQLAAVLEDAWAGVRVLEAKRSQTAAA